MWPKDRRVKNYATIIPRNYRYSTVVSIANSYGSVIPYEELNGSIKSRIRKEMKRILLPSNPSNQTLYETLDSISAGLLPKSFKNLLN